MRISKLEVSIYGVYYGKEDLEMQEWNVYVTEDGLVTRPSYGVALREENWSTLVGYMKRTVGETVGWLISGPARIAEDRKFDRCTTKMR